MAEDLLSKALTVVLNRSDNIQILLKSLEPLLHESDILPLVDGIMDISQRKFSQTIKVAINVCYGGFGLSSKGKNLYRRLSPQFSENSYIPRSDPNLHFVIEKLGKKSFGEYASLTVIEFNVYPGKTVHIHEYDGYESVKLIDGNYKSTLTLCPNAEAIYQEFVKEYNTRIKPCKSGTDIYSWG